MKIFVVYGNNYEADYDILAAVESEEEAKKVVGLNEEEWMHVDYNEFDTHAYDDERIEEREEFERTIKELEDELKKTKNKLEGAENELKATKNDVKLLVKALNEKANAEPIKKQKNR